MYSVKSNSVIMYIVPLFFVVLKMGIKEISIKPDCIWLKSSAFVYVSCLQIIRKKENDANDKIFNLIKFK